MRILAALALALAPAPAAQLVLEAGTPVKLATLGEVSSKTHGQGDRFDLTVSEDVLVDGHVVIPRGARALAEVSRHVAKGAFGKAGEVEIRLLHVIVDGHPIRLDGRREEAGKDAALPAAAVGVVVAGFLGAAIKGKHASIPAGAILTGYVYRDTPFVAD